MAKEITVFGKTIAPDDVGEYPRIKVGRGLVVDVVTTPEDEWVAELDSVSKSGQETILSAVAKTPGQAARKLETAAKKLAERLSALTAEEESEDE